MTENGSQVSEISWKAKELKKKSVEKVCAFGAKGALEKMCYGRYPFLLDRLLDIRSLEALDCKLSAAD